MSIQERVVRLQLESGPLMPPTTQGISLLKGSSGESGHLYHNKNMLYP